MRVLGIDPGYATVGVGAVDYRNNRFSVLEYGAITTPAGIPFPRRLELIYDELTLLLSKYKFDYVSVEKLFFNTNTTTAIDVAQARGVILLAVKKAGVGVFEYTPLQVKQSVVGYGRAEKNQVQEMTRMILNLDKIPRPDDAADALALAVCHAHSCNAITLMKEQL